MRIRLVCIGTITVTIRRIGRHCRNRCRTRRTCSYFPRKTVVSTWTQFTGRSRGIQKHPGTAIGKHPLCALHVGPARVFFFTPPSYVLVVRSTQGTVLETCNNFLTSLCCFGSENSGVSTHTLAYVRSAVFQSVFIRRTRGKCSTSCTIKRTRTCDTLDTTRSRSV